jgi:hypothetical protein
VGVGDGEAVVAVGVGVGDAVGVVALPFPGQVCDRRIPESEPLISATDPA